MALIFASGFELNSVTSAEEFNTITGATIDNTSQMSGVYSGHISSLSSGTAQFFRFQFAAAAGNQFFFSQHYKVSTLPSAENCIFLVNNANDLATPVAYVTLDSGGLLRLYDEDGVIGSASSAISTGTKFQLEVQFDRSAAAGSHIVRARLNNVEFAGSNTRSVSAGIFSANWGGNLLAEAQTTGQWYIDDIIINDVSGSFNTYPGAYQLGIIRPNAAGDSNQWNDTANAAGSTNNYQLVDEVNPDDATTMVQSGTLNDVDMYNYEASGIGASDTVLFAAVSVRFSNNTADTTTAFRVRAEKTSGGTVSESSNIVPNSTAWMSNSVNQPRSAPLIMYTDPDGAAWTQSTLDSMQAGVKLQVANVNRIRVTALWVYFAYVPAAGVTVTPGTASLTTTSFAPVLNSIITTGVLALSLATFAPVVTVSDNQSVTPGVAPLTTATFAPTVSVSDNISVVPSVASLTTTGFEPTVSTTQNVTVEPGALALVTSAFAPDVSVTEDQVVTPSAASLSLTSFAPTILTPRTVTPDTASLSITAFAPQVNLAVTPGVASLTLSTFAPSVTTSDNISVTPDTLSLVTEGFAPVVGVGVITTPDTASLSLTGFAPTVTATTGTYVFPSTATLTLTPYRPIVNHSVAARKYFIDTNGNIFWVLSDSIGLIEKI